MPAPFRRKSIVGGEEARPSEFPWQASLRTTANSHYCGGFIINDWWVMSAAHCVNQQDVNNPSRVVVVIGDWKRDESNAARQSIPAALIVRHPGYSSSTYENDISLIKLSQPISFSEDVAPICGPDSVDQYNYRKSYCSGWGTLSSGASCCPQTLMYVSMNVTTNQFCGTAYGGQYDITPDMICASDNAGGNDRDSCQGDSGGPLAVKDADGTFRAVGIVSWGIGCASGYPGVYQRVSFQHQWILDTLAAN